MCSLSDTIQVEELRGTVSLLSSADSYLDSSGNDYTATCTDCPTNGSSGRLGRALTFDGVGNALDLAVTPAISTVTQLGLDDSFTLMAWVKPTGSPASSLCWQVRPARSCWRS